MKVEIHPTRWNLKLCIDLLALLMGLAFVSAHAIQPGTEPNFIRERSDSARVAVERTIIKDRGDRIVIQTDRNGTDVSINGRIGPHIGSNTPHHEVVAAYEKNGAEKVSHTKDAPGKERGERAPKEREARSPKEVAPRPEPREPRGHGG